MRSEKAAGLIRKKHRMTETWLKTLGWNLGVKYTMSIRNFNLIRSQRRKRKRVV